jgi:RNA polymerase sigma-70 factor (ECF subfamily)
VLAVVDGQPYDVIAEHVGVSIGTIKSRVSRARATLARLLLDPEDTEAVDSAVRTIARNKAVPSAEDDARSSLTP